MERVNIEKHQKINAYIFIVLGSLSLAFSIITINMFYLIEDWFSNEMPTSIDLGILTVHNPLQWLVLFPIANIFIAFFKLITGFGILQCKNWASKMALIIGFFWFFQFPIGTIFSLYIFYSFLDHGTIRAFKTENSDSHLTD